MTTFAVGDVHGCYETLEALLAELGFDPATDELLLTGDLVNRGPRSVEVLRWARRHEDRLTTVLGNHDLHLLAVDAGVRKRRRKDSFDDVLGANDKDDLLEWLRRRPLIHRQGDHLLVHAGLHPFWNWQQAERLARRAQAALRGGQWIDLVSRVYGDSSRFLTADDGDGTTPTFLAAVLRILTTIRICRRSDGALPADFTGSLEDVPPGYDTWFRQRAPELDDGTVIFGHWAALGLHRAERALGLDSGCVWGGALSAVDLASGELTQVARREAL